MVEETNDNSAKEHCAHIDARYGLEQILVCQQALLEAFIEEV